jgi:hypothetical protein
MTMTDSPAPTSLTDELRDTFARVADVLIPRDGACPSASEAQVHGPRIDRLLMLRSDLKEPFLSALTACIGPDAEAAARDLHAKNPDALDLIGMLAAVAYYQNPDVQKATGYYGQTHRDYDADAIPSYVTDGQLQAVIDRGPLFRPTPK